MENKTIPIKDSLKSSKPSVSSVVAVAINASKKSKYVLWWALKNLIPNGEPEKVCFKLIHVFPIIATVPTPAGIGIPIKQVRDDVAGAFRKEVEMRKREKLLPYMTSCMRKKVEVEVVQIESNDVMKAITGEISKCNIKKLVIGASSTGGLFSRKQKLSSKISDHCPSFCTVYVVSKGKLLSVRPSQLESEGSVRDDMTDTSSFGDNFSRNTFISQIDRRSNASTVSYPHHQSPSPSRQFKHLPIIKQNVVEERLCSSDPRTLLYFIGEREDKNGISGCSSPDINYAKRVASSYRSLTTDRGSSTNDQSSCSLEASPDFSSESQVNINFELEKLGMELRQVQGMHAVVSSMVTDTTWELKNLVQHGWDEAFMLQETPLEGEETKGKAKYGEAENAGERAAPNKALCEDTVKEKLENPLLGLGKHYREFTWEEIKTATSSFTENLRVGMGSYGTVYKCRLDHTTIAIKILHFMPNSRAKQLQHELEELSKVRHPHVLTLLGACSEHGCLVYEYMEEGNLDDRLSRKSKSRPIPWFERFRIAHEVASALVFLHNSKPNPIIHCNLKPSNILLDHNLVSKIGDVGLVSMLHTDDFSFIGTMYEDTSHFGSLCYIDPEYQRTGVISPKSDVYAFGMVVLQLLTAKPAIGLVPAVENAINNDDLYKIMDKEAGKWPLEETKELAILALRCTELHHRDRPDLEKEILPALGKLRGIADMARVCTSFIIRGPPDHFICPILKDVMHEPCVAADGYSYDRKAIERWLEEYDISPCTKWPLQHKNLIPNYTLLLAIRQWKSERL